jgi:UDP-3-O-[3-hydroxymyristoyl] glucosamine N-acyltransferase
MIKISQLLNDFGDLLSDDIKLNGKSNTDSEIEINTIASIDNYSETDIVVCTQKKYLEKLSNKKPAAVICDEALASEMGSDINIITSPNPRLAQALIKQSINDYDAQDSEWEAIHHSALIHPTAKIGDNCRIGPNVIIGKDVIIGKNTTIRSACVVEHNSKIGEHCIIHSLVNIGYNTEIGNKVIIRPGAVIGNEGFGLAPDSSSKFHRLPHTGKVVLHDDVQVGSNCNIDRGTYGATTIHRGSKLDALCHIAHNVTIGEDCIITAQCVIAGSSNIGNRVMMSGQTGVLDHVNIVDDVVLVHRAAVIDDINEKGMWAGLPAKPLKAHIKSVNLEKRLEKKISKLEQRLSDFEEKNS